MGPAGQLWNVFSSAGRHGGPGSDSCIGIQSVLERLIAGLVAEPGEALGVLGAAWYPRVCQGSACAIRTHVDQVEGRPGLGSFESLPQRADWQSEGNSALRGRYPSGCPWVVNSLLGHGNFRERLRAHGKHYYNPCGVTSQIHPGILTSQARSSYFLPCCHLLQPRKVLKL